MNSIATFDLAASSKTLVTYIILRSILNSYALSWVWRTVHVLHLDDKSKKYPSSDIKKAAENLNNNINRFLDNKEVLILKVQFRKTCWILCTVYKSCSCDLFLFFFFLRSAWSYLKNVIMRQRLFSPWYFTG